MTFKEFRASRQPAAVYHVNDDKGIVIVKAGSLYAKEYFVEVREPDYLLIFVEEDERFETYSRYKMELFLYNKRKKDNAASGKNEEN
jgi:hypothetical protein